MYIEMTGNDKEDAQLLVCLFSTLSYKQKRLVFDLVNSCIEKNIPKNQQPKKGIVIQFPKMPAGDNRNILNE